jgi:hypothetical protein
MYMMTVPENIYVSINLKYMAALKLIGAGEVTRERKITGFVFGTAHDGSRAINVTFQEQLFKDSVAINDKVLITWNYTEANIGTAIPEVQTLFDKLDAMLMANTQADSLIVEA